MGRVLVVKVGYRSALDGFVSRRVSLASVVRATAALHRFAGDEVTWVTSAPALPLISGAPGVTRALSYDAAVSLALSRESFDVVANLESTWEFCALAESVAAGARFGFALDAGGTEVVALPGAGLLLALELSRAARRRESRPREHALFEALGGEWSGEPFVLGLRPTNRETFDVGLNVLTGSRGIRAWPSDRWARLETLLSRKGSVSRRPAAVSLEGYVDWLNACRVVVSADALGLYLALALGKKVVGLFGATPAAACPTFGRGVCLAPPVRLNCIPCCDTECRFGKPCVATLAPERVAEAVETLRPADVPAK